MYKLLLIWCCIFFTTGLFAQRLKADSVKALLAKEKVDSNRVRLLWQQANFSNMYAPDSALAMAREALYLAQRIKYAEGASRSIGIIANTFIRIGNFNKALEYYLRKLQLDEERGNPRSLASVNMNIGITYANLEEYDKALQYYLRADSIIRQHDVTDFKFSIALNIGDLYDRTNVSDSSYFYFDRSLQIAHEQNDSLSAGLAMVGVGNSLRKMKSYELAGIYYTKAMPLLIAGNDNDLICEATLGMAKIYQAQGDYNKAIIYADSSLDIASRADFLSRRLEAASLLASVNKQAGKIGDALNYMELSQVLKDSIYSKNKIRESVILSSNEQERQIAMEEARRQATEERSQQLQYLFISIFIPSVFLLTLFLSRKRVPVRLIKFMGIISLLMFFEFITLLLHPKVAEFTHHNPVYELLIFVCMASIIIPTHHRIEHWIVEKLTQRSGVFANHILKLRTVKLRMKKPSR